MPDVIAFFASIAAVVMLLAVDWQTGWTPGFLTAFGIVAAVCLAALTVGAIERHNRPPAPTTCPCCHKEAT